MDFIKNILCPPGKEIYNNKCVKNCPPGKMRNPKTGRCIKIKASKTSKKSIEPLNYFEPVKSVKSVKMLSACPPGKELYNGKCLKACDYGKTRNLLTGRCVKPKTLKKRVSPLKRISPLKRPSPMKVSNGIGKQIYDKYNLDQESRNYLNKLVVNASANKMRELANKYDLYIQLSSDDKIMKEYILKEILSLAQYDARDRFKTETIKLINISHVIDDDMELSIILKGYHPNMPPQIY